MTLSGAGNMKTPEGIAMLDNVRRICESLPETSMTIDGFGHTTFKVCGKSFVIMGDSDGEAGLSFKSDRENQALLLAQGDGRFYKTPYIGQHGWVSTKAGSAVDWAELGELIKEAYLRAAPRRIRKLYIALP